MNIKGQKDIGSSPMFTSEEMKQNFLKRQLEKYKEVRDGDATWADLNEFRQEHGYPDVNTDSLRRSFAQIGTYLDAGWDFNCPDESEVEDPSIPPIGEKESVSINFDKGETTSQKFIALAPGEVNDPKALLKAHGFDPVKWDVKSVNNMKSRRTSHTGDTEYYSSRILVRPKENTIVGDLEEIGNYFTEFAKTLVKAPVEMTQEESKEDLIIPLYDMHWGRLPDEENFEKFDVKAEQDKIVFHVKKYINKFEGRHFNKVYLIVGQDFFNSSFTGFTSSQSHLQSNAIDFRTMFKSGSELLIRIIDMFAETCNDLQVVGSLGNHDTAESFALFQLLDAYYRMDDHITVDNGGAPRKYLDLGNSCVGVGHLDKERDRAFGLMQIEAKEIWAKTKIHVFIAGHLHHFSVDSKQGVEIYRVPSICYHDRWTNEQGYVMNEPKTMCFIFDEKEGLSETHFMYL